MFAVKAWLAFPVLQAKFSPMWFTAETTVLGRKRKVADSLYRKQCETEVSANRSLDRKRKIKDSSTPCGPARSLQ